MNILFMLPARAGSKGVPDKNIKNLGGHPLMWYAIRAIKDSPVCGNHRVTTLVSTDSEEYKKIALDCGADCVMLRDKELASDNSPIVDTIKSVIAQFRHGAYDLFGLVQVTSPFLSTDDVERVIRVFENDPNLESAVSVTESEIMPLWCNVLPESMSLHNFIAKEIRTKNRQELPTYYRVTGAIRVARWESYIKNGYDFFEGNGKAVILEQSHSLDIDTMNDFRLAEYLMEARNA